MRDRWFVLVPMLCLGMAYAAPAAHTKTLNPPPPGTGPFRCTSQKHLINLSVNDSGQTVEGPACAQIAVNALRYTAYLGKKYSAPTAGPALGSIFPASFEAGGQAPPPKATKGLAPAPPGLEEKFGEVESQVDDVIRRWTIQEAQNRKQAALLAQDLTALQNTIAQSDATFNQSGAAGVLDLLKQPATQAILNKASMYSDLWKTSDEVVERLQILQLAVNSLPMKFPSDSAALSGDACSGANIRLLGWTNWDKCYDARFKLLQSSLTAALIDTNLWTSDSDKAAQFVKNLNVLTYWHSKAATLTPDSFVLQSEVRCGVLFNQSQAIAINLYTTDQTGMFPGQTVQQPVSTTILNVNCSSAFAVSAGAAFNTIRNPEYTIVQSAPPAGGTTPVPQVGESSNSAINPYPVALAHARLKDWGDNRYAAHYSFGVGVNPNSGGTAAPEFMTGPTLSFLRTMFVTAGLDVGKQTALAGGFHLGDTVPSGVSTIPTSTSYKAGFGFAITFTKP